MWKINFRKRWPQVSCFTFNSKLPDFSAVYFSGDRICFKVLISPKCVYGCKDFSPVTFVLVRKYGCEMDLVFFTRRYTKQNGEEDKTHFNMYRESISYFC